MSKILQCNYLLFSSAAASFYGTYTIIFHAKPLRNHVLLQDFEAPCLCLVSAL